MKNKFIGVGTLHLPKNAQDFFSTAFDLGVNVFDTAPSYQEGRADVELGRFLADVNRDEVHVFSKVFYAIPNSEISEGLSKDNINLSVERTLENLKTTYLDVLFFHRYDRFTPVETSLQTLQEYLNTGTVKEWGFSAYSLMEAVQLCEKAIAMGLKLPKYAQYAYNLFNRTVELELQYLFDYYNIEVVGYYPLAQGVLSGKYASKINDARANNDVYKKNMWDLTPDKIRRASQLNLYAQKKGISAPALAFAWCFTNPQVTGLLTSFSNKKQLEDVLTAKQLKLENDDFKELDNIFGSLPLRNTYMNLKYNNLRQY